MPDAEKKVLLLKIILSTLLKLFLNAIPKYLQGMVLKHIWLVQAVFASTGQVLHLRAFGRERIQTSTCKVIADPSWMM